MSCAAAKNSTAVIAGSVSATVGALLIVVAVALLTVGIIFKWKRVEQTIPSQEHYYGYVGKTLYVYSELTGTQKHAIRFGSYNLAGSAVFQLTYICVSEHECES